MPHAVDTIVHGTIGVSLYPEEVGDSNPREWDNLGTMATWHRRYILGDEQPKCSPDEWLHDLAMSLAPGLEEQLSYWEEEGYRCLRRKYGQRLAVKKSEGIQARLIEKVLDREVPVMLPLYLYDHSGITMNTRGFSCPWDSGQVGWIYATRETIEKEYGKVDDETLALARRVLKGEVDTYDLYLRGEVYGYVARCQECGITLDSCWGFFGLDDARSEGKDVALSLGQTHVCPDYETGV